MNARKQSEVCNAGMREHLKAIHQVTSRGADFKAFREFMQVRVAHDETL
jgi:hypothetical protein